MRVWPSENKTVGPLSILNGDEILCTLSVARPAVRTGLESRFLRLKFHLVARISTSVSTLGDPLPLSKAGIPRRAEGSWVDALFKKREMPV